MICNAHNIMHWLYECAKVNTFWQKIKNGVNDETDIRLALTSIGGSVQGARLDFPVPVGELGPDSVVLLEWEAQPLVSPVWFHESVRRSEGTRVP